ncbi:hypothetical protein C8R45DRAFT_923929 [Mycena sanguinolenta]|nr:hypothetical protein C8R45DRAFT_923929 [Mycena sanguinolenta]
MYRQLAMNGDLLVANCLAAQAMSWSSWENDEEGEDRNTYWVQLYQACAITPVIFDWSPRSRLEYTSRVTRPKFYENFRSPGKTHVARNQDCKEVQACLGGPGRISCAGALAVLPDRMIRHRNFDSSAVGINLEPIFYLSGLHSAVFALSKSTGPSVSVHTCENLEYLEAGSENWHLMPVKIKIQRIAANELESPQKFACGQKMLGNLGDIQESVTIRNAPDVPVALQPIISYPKCGSPERLGYRDSTAEAADRNLQSQGLPSTREELIPVLNVHDHVGQRRRRHSRCFSGIRLQGFQNYEGSIPVDKSTFNVWDRPMGNAVPIITQEAFRLLIARDRTAFLYICPQDVAPPALLFSASNNIFSRSVTPVDGTFFLSLLGWWVLHLFCGPEHYFSVPSYQSAGTLAHIASSAMNMAGCVDMVLADAFGFGLTDGGIDIKR